MSIRSRSVLAALALCATALPAQELTLVVRIRGGTLPIEADTLSWLVHSLDLTPHLAAAAQSLAGAKARVLNSPGARSTPGTFGLSVSMPDRTTPIDAKEREALTKAICTAVAQRLNAAYYEPDALEIDQEIAQRTQHVKVLMQEADPTAAAAPLRARAEALQVQQNLLRQQLADAEMTLATEEGARRHLENQVAMRREEQQKLAATLNDLASAIAAKQGEIEQESAELDALLRTAATSAAVQERRARLADQQRACDKLLTDRQVAAAQRAEIDQASGPVLEQLPATATLLERTKSRLVALKQAIDEHTKTQEQLRDQAEVAARGAATAELRQIELQATRQRLLELHVERARLSPLRVVLVSTG